MGGCVRSETPIHGTKDVGGAIPLVIRHEVSELCHAGTGEVAYSDTV